MQTKRNETKYCPFNFDPNTIISENLVCGDDCAWYNNDKEECNFVTLSRNIQYIRKQICLHEIPNETHK